MDTGALILFPRPIFSRGTDRWVPTGADGVPESARVIRSVVPRLGLLAIGLVYVAIGFLAARVALLGASGRVAGVPGALRYILGRPYGRPALWFVGLGLLGYGVWRLSRGAAARRRPVLTRLSDLAAGLGHVALAWTAFRILLRVRGSDSGAARLGIGWLIGHPAGRLALQLIALAVLLTGLAAIYRGLSGRLPGGLSPSALSGTPRRVAVRAGRFGFLAEGVVLLVIGYFLLRVVSELDPGEYREIGGSLRILSGPPFGSAMLVAVALGLIVFGLYHWVLALYGRPE
jgi:hypothetical protein